MKELTVKQKTVLRTIGLYPAKESKFIRKPRYGQYWCKEHNKQCRGCYRNSTDVPAK